MVITLAEYPSVSVLFMFTLCGCYANKSSLHTKRSHQELQGADARKKLKPLC